MSRRVSSSTLIGRDAELTALRATVDQAGRGVPSLTLVAGEAGVGKSRLLRELARSATADGRLVLWGECVPVGDGELPYAPIIAALRDLARGAAAPQLDTIPPELRGELGRLVPEIAGEPADGRREGRASEFSQGRLYERLLAVLRHVSAETGVLMVLEDLHWADHATRDFLAFAVRNLRDERLALVGTYRTDELDREHPLRALLSELIRRDLVARVELDRLSRADTEHQLAAILGRLPDAALVEQLFRRAQGNPFLAEELLAAREAKGGDTVPGSLRDALMVRVDRLPAPALDVLRIVSAAGRPVDDGLLAAAAGMAPERTAAALREAVAGHALVMLREHGTYTFRHSLVRELLYEALLPGERIAIHERLAAALEARGADPAELAYHWHAAGRRPAALKASVEAGLAAARVYAFVEALTHYGRALALWDDVAPAPGELARDRLDVLHAAARAARLTGDYERATALCTEGLAAVDAVVDPVRAAAFHECLGECRFWDDESGLESYRAALALLPEDRVADRARVVGAEARALTHVLSWDQACRRSELALELARAADSLAEERRARATLGVALAFLGDPQQGEAHLRAAVAGPEREAPPDELARAYLALAEVLRVKGDFGAAFDVMVDGCHAAERLGLQGSFGRFMAVNAAEDLFRLGRWDEAEQRLRDTGRLKLRLTSALLQHTVSAQLNVARGDFALATEHLERVRSMCEGGVPAEFVPGVYAAAAELALWEGRHDDARQEVESAFAIIGALEDPLNTPPLYTLGVRAEADAADYARAVGVAAAVAAARDSARALIARFDDLLSRHSMRDAPPEALAHRAACSAELARLERAPDPAAWDTAAAAWKRVEAPYPMAYARWRQADALLAGDGNRAAAAAALREAASGARALGAAPLQTAIDALARAARLAPSAAPAPADRVDAPAGLTAREVEVLRLVADGLTNQQIGARLYISERTAGVHVSHILGKLDARNRVVAAGIARQLGLVTQPPAA